MQERKYFHYVESEEYCKRKHFPRYLRKQRRYLVLNVSAYISDDGSSKEHKPREETLHKKNRKRPIDSNQLFAFPIPLANERREAKLPSFFFHNYTLYFISLSSAFLSAKTLTSFSFTYVARRRRRAELPLRRTAPASSSAKASSPL